MSVILTVTKEQKNYLCETLPWLHVVVVNRQKSKRKKYMVQDDKAVRNALKNYEERVLKVVWRLPEEPKGGVKKNDNKSKHNKKKNR